MEKQYTLTHKTLFLVLLFSLGFSLNEPAKAEFFDGIMNQGNASFQNYQQRALNFNQTAQGNTQAWGKGNADGSARGDAEGEIDFSINLKVKARTQTEMQQSRQFEGFMSQMRNMSQSMFQQRQFQNRFANQLTPVQNHWGSYPMPQYPTQQFAATPAQHQ